jgi:hypothetical protein
MVALGLERLERFELFEQQRRQNSIGPSMRALRDSGWAV